MISKTDPDGTPLLIRLTSGLGVGAVVVLAIVVVASPNLVMTLPWWLWWTGAAVIWLNYQLSDWEKWLPRASAIAGIGFCGLVGLVRFVKWVWLF